MTWKNMVLKTKRRSKGQSLEDLEIENQRSTRLGYTPMYETVYKERRKNSDGYTTRMYARVSGPVKRRKTDGYTAGYMPVYKEERFRRLHGQSIHPCT